MHYVCFFYQGVFGQSVEVPIKVGNRPPGGCVRYSALNVEHASESAIADVAARRSATYRNLELVDGLIIHHKRNKSEPLLFAFSFKSSTNSTD